MISLKPPRGESTGFTQQIDTTLPLNSVLFFALGGCLSNLSVFLLSFIIFSENINTLRHLQGSIYWITFAIFFLFFNLVSFTANLTPFPGTDGWHIQNLLPYRNVAETIVYHTYPRPVFLQYDDLYREFPISNVKNRKYDTVKSSLPSILVMIIFCVILCSLKF